MVGVVVKCPVCGYRNYPRIEGINEKYYQNKFPFPIDITKEDYKILKGGGIIDAKCDCVDCWNEKETVKIQLLKYKML